MKCNLRVKFSLHFYLFSYLIAFTLCGYGTTNWFVEIQNHKVNNHELNIHTPWANDGYVDHVTTTPLGLNAP
jgi:hypothetical protein